MATLLGKSRKGDIRIAGKDDGQITVEETWTFIVQADDKFEPRINVALATGIVVNQTTSSGGLTVCRSLNGSFRSNEPTIWDFTAEFSSEVSEGQDNPDPDTDPNAWVPVYQTRFERMEEQSVEDVSGTVIANSAGQPFPEGLILPRTIPMWEFYQFEPSSVNDETVIDRHETVNSTTFRGRDPKTLLCLIQSSEIGFYYGQRRRLTRYLLKYNSKKWTDKRQDQGTIFLDGSGDPEAYTIPIKNASGEEEGKQVILGSLDGSGGKAADGDPPALLEFDRFTAVEFSDFLRT